MNLPNEVMRSEWFLEDQMIHTFISVALSIAAAAAAAAAAATLIFKAEVMKVDGD